MQEKEQKAKEDAVKKATEGLKDDVSKLYEGVKNNKKAIAIVAGVAAVGAARPKEVFYGNNRADFSAIPGNVAPGLLFRHPDHFENYDDWPFFWGQNEGTIAGNISYLIFGSAFKDLVKGE